MWMCVCERAMIYVCKLVIWHFFCLFFICLVCAIIYLFNYLMRITKCLLYKLIHEQARYRFLYTFVSVC